MSNEQNRDRLALAHYFQQIEHALRDGNVSMAEALMRETELAVRSFVGSKPQFRLGPRMGSGLARPEYKKQLY
jgi:hypothetical protein